MQRAVHPETGVQVSIAWDHFHKTISMKLIKESDQQMKVLAGLCREEVVEVRVAPEHRCFATNLTVVAQWAEALLPSVPLNFHETRLRLIGYIIDAWLHTHSKTVEESLVVTLLKIPRVELLSASNRMRQIIEFRFDGKTRDARVELCERCLRLLSILREDVQTCGPLADLALGLNENPVARAAVKAMARYAPMDLVVSTLVTRTR